MSLIKYNVPGIESVAQQIASAKAISADVVVAAQKLRAGAEVSFQGGGGEGFQESYTRAIALVNTFSEKLNQAENAVNTARENMVARDMGIRATYV